MLFRSFQASKKIVLGLSIGSGLAVWGHRSWKLRGDRILNLFNDPYLTFAEEQRRQGKQFFSPWTTTNEHDLQLAQKYFPEIPIPVASQLIAPSMKPVEFLPLKDLEVVLPEEKEKVILVGGPSAAMGALAEVMAGNQNIVYVTDTNFHHPENKKSRSIMAGAANLFVTDAATISPPYMSGHAPQNFLMNAIFQFINPARYDQEVMGDHYPWLNLNIADWVRNPSQISAGLRVMKGNHQLAQDYAACIQKGINPDLPAQMQQRISQSTSFLTSMDAQLGGIFRKPTGLLLIATDEKDEKELKHEEDALAREGQPLVSHTLSSAQAKYGFVPQQIYSLKEKTSARIFDPQFVKNVSAHVKRNGGEVIDQWRLNRVFVDTEKNAGGVLEFIDSSNEVNQCRYLKFSQAHLSLGATPYSPNPYDLISVTGVSINAIVTGVKFSGGPMIRAKTVHIVPLAAPQIHAEMDSKTNMTDISFLRITAAGSIGPVNRGEHWYEYEGSHAVFALNQLRKTLPADSTVRVLSVVGCNRVIGKDSRQVELHPTVVVDGQVQVVKTVTLQMGAGGAGLIQSGAIADKPDQHEATICRPSC